MLPTTRNDVHVAKTALKHRQTVEGARDASSCDLERPTARSRFKATMLSFVLLAAAAAVPAASLSMGQPHIVSSALRRSDDLAAVALVRRRRSPCALIAASPPLPASPCRAVLRFCP